VDVQLVIVMGWERGSPEPLMRWLKVKKERLWRAALPAI
jgi:hypothetical protein